MRFCCNVLRNSRVIGIAMTLKNKLSFKLDLYFMKFMHPNIKMKYKHLRKKIIFDFFIIFEFSFTS